MKSIDLPIGSHVAYDQNQARDHHMFVEAFVMAGRSKGKTYSYWGKNNNHDTIGIAYTTSWSKDADGNPVWLAAWVRPATIHMLWEVHQGIVEKSKREAVIRDQRQREERENRSIRLEAIPKEVLKALNIADCNYEALRLRNYTNVYISIGNIEAVIQASRRTDPETMSKRIQVEIESALALL